MPRWTVALLFLILPAIAGAQAGLVKAEQNLTLRAEPKPSAKALDQLSRFQPVKILEHKDKWVKVRTIKTDPAQSREGWVVAAFVSDNLFLTVDRDKLNVRAGPGTEHPIIMNYSKPYPIFVLDVARNGWVKVLDFDGDRGWIQPASLAFGPRYVITKTNQSNIRSGGGKGYEQFPVAFTAERGVYLQVVEEKDGWLHVKHDQGQEGWISSKLVFGWVDEEQPKTARKAEKKVETPAKARKSETTTKARTGKTGKTAKPKSGTSASKATAKKTS